MSNGTTDPSGFVTSPPSTIVKVVNTARDDINGQLGYVTAYNQGRGRYIVHMTGTQSTTALKPENLVRGNMVDKAKANFQQIRNDPNIKRQLQEVYNVMDRKIPDPYKPEHAALALLVLVVGCIYVIGFTKMLSLVTLLMLLGVILAPDLMAAASSQQPPSIQTIAANFPRRCRETIEQSFPSFAGKVTDKIALGIVVVLVVFVGKGLLTSPAKQARRTIDAANAAASATSTVGSSSSLSSSTSMIKQSSEFLEQAYKSGFDDATSGKEFGTSLSQVIANYREDRETPMEPLTTTTVTPPNLDFEDSYSNYLSSQSPQKSSFGFSTAMSFFAVIRTGWELGRDPMGGFDINRMVANAKTMEPWKMGIVGFSVYNILRAFM
eukprot:CAMPEP_0195290070 /NCGR_PEP_ID=MMETSP0707-20130614/6083_1 /TAXON_ID=33640 /ORGANISM="Asterionellopsis glacialis, Strain CCMP134" /LENGTH=379 /DNA_ID=CAMNT_0040350143 /DNA_START=77 /DNA_END=1216 /DNA_ORIENTATION=+